MAGRRFHAAAGSPDALGVTILDEGVNVAVTSRNADSVHFCVFDESDTEVARLPLPSRVGDVFCGFVAGVGPGTRYGLRADGPWASEAGHRFDPAKLLVDPYAIALDRPFRYSSELAAPPSAGIDTARLVPKAIVTALPEDLSPRGMTPVPGFTYELSVKAFSARNPAIPEAVRGTVAALTHPASLDHLVQLGVDTVELMPLAAWIDERHLPPLNLANAWGYNPIVFMAPDPRLAPGGLADVRALVAALHAVDINVILDAVYNHTGESDLFGPTLSLRGLDNALYYRAARDDPALLINDTGTGNTLAVDRPAVMQLILDAMRRWATATGIDGFRLDLASILGRTDTGFHRDAPIFAAIDADPVLGRLTMIAEPWDVGPGGYQLGNFPPRWHEWNDRYRDDVRCFWRGDPHTLGTLATRLAGSSDIFGDRRPSAGVNFVAAHDGFALADVVAFERKHNEANGEQNRDGTDANFSWNNGVEGASPDPATRAARLRDVRAMLATLFLSRGIPMLTAGDELGRTQGGNNNAYAQDNPVTWIDWDHADGALSAFVGRLAELRATHASLHEDRFLTGSAVDASGIPDAVWLAAEGGAMSVADWEGGRRCLGLALYVATEIGGDRSLIWINGETSPSAGWLPASRPGRRWILAMNSAAPVEPQPAASATIAIPPRAVLLFVEGAA